jgi:hypothetical protein
MDRDARRKALKEKKLWASKTGFKMWERNDGRDFATVRRGEKAAWLGGDVVSWLFNPTEL